MKGSFVLFVQKFFGFLNIFVEVLINMYVWYTQRKINVRSCFALTKEPSLRFKHFLWNQSGNGKQHFFSFLMQGTIEICVANSLA